MAAWFGRRTRPRGKGGKPGAPAGSGGADGGTSLPENEFHGYGNLPTLTLGTQHFERSFPVFFKDVTCKIFLQSFYF